jgi:pyruvate ferredoxin oxidoreductase alpha subunit
MHMSTQVALTGNEAVAEAFRQVNPDVAAVYPITPQTELMHAFAAFAADGVIDTEVVTVESEHSALSACVGAAAAGARTVTATSSQGLALMWEILYIASSYRLPIVAVVVNRALSGPINIHCDHSDTMGARDSGWIQIFSEGSQEAYDNTIQAFRIAEHKDILLPAMVTLDGFIISHTMEALEILDDDQVKGFVGEFDPVTNLLDVDHPITMGPLHLPDFYYETKRAQDEAMGRVMPVILEVAEEYAQLSGRTYGLFETYRLDDAEVAVIVLGSAAGTAKVAVDALRNRGVKAGLLKLRVFRPFPGEEIVQAIAHVPAVAVMDRSISFGLKGGPVFNEVRSFAYGREIKLMSYIYGLGGRDVPVEHIESVFNDLVKANQARRVERIYNYLGVRE